MVPEFGIRVVVLFVIGSIRLLGFGLLSILLNPCVRVTAQIIRGLAAKRR